MAGKRYIVVNDWDRFQHYKDRNPSWVKLYTRLLDDEAFLDLTVAQRSLLLGLWLAYAKTHRKVPDSTPWLSRYLAQKVTRGMLDTLSHAGFISFSASAPLAPSYEAAIPEEEEETERETERTFQPNDGEQEKGLEQAEPRDEADHELRNLVDSLDSATSWTLPNFRREFAGPDAAAVFHHARVEVQRMKDRDELKGSDAAYAHSILWQTHEQTPNATPLADVRSAYAARQNGHGENATNGTQPLTEEQQQHLNAYLTAATRPIE